MVEFLKVGICQRGSSRAFGVGVMLALFACTAFALADDRTAAPVKPCMARTHDGTDYVVCRFDPAQNEIRLLLNNGDGDPYRHFNFVNDELAQKGQRLVFAMNAGMYHEDRSPVGFYLENGVKAASLNSNDGPGNFHLKPNGVFFIDTDGNGAVLATQDFAKRFARPQAGEWAATEIDYATQSGPMLVIDGNIHPKFLPESTSRKRRNGVGVTDAGEVIFVLADSPVRFYDFAAFFKDELEVPNALFLDGSISRLYAPDLGRNDPGAAMGPIVGVVVSEE